MHGCYGYQELAGNISVLYRL